MRLENYKDFMVFFELKERLRTKRLSLRGLKLYTTIIYNFYPIVKEFISSGLKVSC